MNFDRRIKLSRKFIRIIGLGLRPTAILGMTKGPKVIINSIPKSGTNLIQEMLHNFPLLRGVITRTLTSKMDENLLTCKFRRIKKGQCIPAHLFYDKKLENIMIDKDIRMILVVRDFRDAILSHINYIDNIDVDHPHHLLFSGLSSLDDKIDICLKGAPESGFTAWGDLVHGFRGWLASSRVLMVRFEDIIGRQSHDEPDKRRASIIKIAEFLDLRGVNIDFIVSKMYDKRGLTFHSPSSGKWKIILSAPQANKITSCLASELSFFGYDI